MMSPLMIYAAAKPLPVNDSYSSSPMSQVEMQKQLAIEQKKAQEEMYKAMGLSTAEIAYIEKNDFEAIKNRLDKYVTYDKDGYAKMAKITSAQSRKDGISSQEISIGLKMVANYNETVKNYDKKAMERKVGNPLVQKTVENKGIRVEVDLTGIDWYTSKQQLQSRALTCKPRILRTISQYGWWTQTHYMDIDNCAAELIAKVAGGISMVTGTVAFLCTAGFIVGSVCTVGMGTISAVFGILSKAVDQVNYWCGKRGVRVGFTAMNKVMIGSPWLWCPA